MRITFVAILFFYFLPILNTEASPLLKTETIRCGTNLNVKAYARKINGQWQGFDADICRIFAAAVYGDANKFQLINVPSAQISKALKDGTIDVMLSGGLYSASMEARQEALTIGLLYYDHQAFAVKDAPEDIRSMEAFKGKKVCVYSKADYYKNVIEYSQKHNLQLQIMPYDTQKKARDAFLLKRCELYTARGLLLQSIISQSPGKNLEILPEEFAFRPIYAYVSPTNPRLYTALKWVLNALYLAEDLGIGKDNASLLIDSQDISTRNLLGIDKTLWTQLGLKPEWAQQMIAEMGNMGEIFERNLGLSTPYGLSRGKANLVRYGGNVSAQEFK